MVGTRHRGARGSDEDGSDEELQVHGQPSHWHRIPLLVLLLAARTAAARYKPLAAAARRRFALALH